MSGVATGAEPARLSKAGRRETVATLRAEGYSLRAIAEKVGSSLGAVQRDLEGVSGDTPERVVGLDGKRYTVRRSSAAEAAERGSGPVEGVPGA